MTKKTRRDKQIPNGDCVGTELKYPRFLFGMLRSCLEFSRCATTGRSQSFPPDDGLEQIEDELSQGCKTIAEPRNFLIELGQSFSTICSDAIGGHYNHDFFKNDVDDEKRLYTNLMKKHREFAETLCREGALWKIFDGNDKGSNNENLKTRDWAIGKAYEALKRKRGTEVWESPWPFSLDTVIPLLIEQELTMTYAVARRPKSLPSQRALPRL
jgi:hypothetical protein